MNKYVILLFIATVSMGCSTEEKFKDLILEWEVGSDSTIVIKNINTHSNQNVEIVVNRNSLCDNSGVELTCSSNGQLLFNHIATETTYIANIVVPSNEKVEIKTQIVDVNSDIICVWLGQAKCKLTYKGN